MTAPFEVAGDPDTYTDYQDHAAHKTAVEALAKTSETDAVGTEIAALVTGRITNLEREVERLREHLVERTTAYDALVAAIAELAHDTTETEYLRLRAGNLLDTHLKEHN